MEKIEIICPLFQAEKEIARLHRQLLMQQSVQVEKIHYILTESEDRTEEILQELQAEYVRISPKEFSHSLTREQALFEVKTTYALLITQDIEMSDVLAIAKLLRFCKEHELALAYGRQIAKGRTLDRYFRQISYPERSHIYEKNDLDTLGQKACFCSDVFAIYRTDIFQKEEGYDHLSLETNEDMYYAYKMLKNHYKVGYCADAWVFHTHRYTLKQTYRRYQKIGRFFERFSEIGRLSHHSRMEYLKAIWLMLKVFNIHSLLYFPWNVSARILGLHSGKKGYSYDHQK